jgi:hypothetical protein
MPDSLATFAANLRRIREERGLSQERLAHAADLNMTTSRRFAKLSRCAEGLCRRPVRWDRRAPPFS